MLQKLLCSLDIYGAKVELNFNKKRIHNTMFGGILTLTVFIFFGLGFWFSAKNLITRESPTVISSMRSVLQPERVYVNKQNLTLMVSITDINGKLVNDPSVINVYAIQESVKNSFDEAKNITIQSITQTHIKMVQCSLDSVGNSELLSYFEKINYSSMYCFSDVDPDIFIEGDSDSTNFSEIFIYIQKCQNSINNISCLPSEKIDSILKSSKVNVFMSDQFFDPYSFIDPFKFRGINLQSLASSHMPKEIQIFFMNQYVQDDVGILVNDISEKRGFYYSDTRDQVFYTEENMLARLLLRMAKNRESFISRRYLKITDVVGQLGGLLKILMTAGSILSIPFVRLHLHKAIINEIFNFKFVQERRNKRASSQKKKQPKSQLSPERRSKKTLYSQNEVPNSNENREQKSMKFIRSRSRSRQNMGASITEEAKNEVQSAKLRQAGNQLQQELQSCCLDSNYKIKKRKTIIEAAKTIFVVTKSIIKYGFFDYIVHFLFPQAKSILRKKILVDQSISRIFEHLDVLYILNKMLEIEKLKKILLNEDQLRLFEFIPKPEIEEDKLKELLGVEESNQPKNSETNTIKNRGRIEIIENGKIQDSGMQTKKFLDNKNLYDLYSHQKPAAEKALDAYQGLVNILKKDKKSDRDNKLIELIDPTILEQYQLQIHEFEKKNQISMQQSIPISMTKQQITALEHSNEEFNASASFNNVIHKTTSNHIPRSSNFQSNRNIFNLFKQQSDKSNQIESEIMSSSSLSIPQEIKGGFNNLNPTNEQQIGFFKSLKELNLCKQFTAGNSPLKRKMNSSGDISLQLSTSLSKQQLKSKRQKKLFNS